MDDGADMMGDTNHEGAIFCIDRGYRLPSISRMFNKAHCHEIGTIQRQKTAALFPFTFDHPEVAHNVPCEGVPVSIHARKGAEVALACRGFSGKVVLLKSTKPTFLVPREACCVPPPPVPPLPAVDAAPEAGTLKEIGIVAQALELLSEGASVDLALALGSIGEPDLAKSCRHAMSDGEAMDPDTIK